MSDSATELFPTAASKAELEDGGVLSPRFSADGLRCLECQGDTYSPMHGRIHCHACPAGKFASDRHTHCRGSGRPTKAACPAGKFQAMPCQNLPCLRAGAKSWPMTVLVPW